MELLCVDGIGWSSDVERSGSKLLNVVDDGAGIITELLLCVTGDG